jgi:imidazolonepropionase-like amidohydrolase
MAHHITRREALRLFAGAGAMALLGGCAKAPSIPIYSTPPPKKGEAFALVNAAVVDVAAGTLRPGAAVSIRDGVIESIGAPLPGARLYDCRGGYLIPGLINAHSHLNMPSLMGLGIGNLSLMRAQIVKNYEDAVCWGVTTVRDMTSVPKMIVPDREAIDHGEMLGPHILTPISFITVPHGYPDFGGVGSPIAELFTGKPLLFAETPEKCRDYVKQVRDQGANLVKIGFDDRSFIWGRGAWRLKTLSDAQVEAILSEAARCGLPVAAHHLYLNGLDRGLKLGVERMEHVPSDGPLTDAQVRGILDKKTMFTPTIMIGAAMTFAKRGVEDPADPRVAQLRRWRDEVQMGELPRHCLPEVAAQSKDIYRYYESGAYARPENRRKPSFDPVLASRLLVNAANNVARLIKEGVELGVGNDSGVPFIFPGMVHLEMDLLCRLGMTPAQALRSATLVNARICNVADRCGSIEPGKRADLVLLAGDPLADVANVGKVQAVFKQGALVATGEGFAMRVL